YRIKGLPGAMVATLGTVLPSFFIILIIAINFYQYRDNPTIEKVFLGIRPAIVALILSAVYKLMKSVKLGYLGAFVAVATVLIIVFLGINPIYLIIAGALGAVIFKKYIEKK
ncbi:MAG: chromate transporter, partial [Tissierellia bacterium]|nr:chromate transporter [Tissierellia bacterium]